MYIPYYPSNWKALEKLKKILYLPPGARFIDLGSGGGRVLATVSKLYDDIYVYGVEKNPLLVYASRKYLNRRGLNATVIEGDLFKVDLEKFNVVYGYLTRDALMRLRNKVIRYLNNGGLLITLDFRVPKLKPYASIEINDWSGRHKLHIYGRRDAINKYIIF